MQEYLSLERVSARVEAMKISPTIAMSVRAAELKAAGHDIISLALGELDFNTPDEIIEAAHSAAINGMTRYTAPDGTPALKKAVCQKFKRDNDLSFNLNQIHVASGCKQVIYNALAATLDPGDEVVIFSPYWVSYADVIEFCGGKVVVVQTRPEDGFIPDPGQLAQALTGRTRWVLLNSPNNPTGAVYTAGRMRQMADVIKPHPGILVMADEIYEHLTFDDCGHVSFLRVAQEMEGRVLTVNGVSKSYAMTGWRIGYAAGPTWLISAMAKVQSQTAGNSCSVAQAAAEQALNGDQGLIQMWRATLQGRRDRALHILAGSRLMTAYAAQGSFYSFCDVRRCIGAATPNHKVLRSDGDVADYLLEVAGVATVAGEAFGTSPFLRISFAVELDRLEEACHRIVRALGDLNLGGACA
ncbi:hypothetical protein N185_17645 [Sinorhizobium sp. GW3]|nr:hypothetical protein N185_17645 [Sinorhizobium sp. GW3]